MRFFKPEIFQGSLKKKNYFEGWYYKHVSKDLSEVFAFIPGISFSKEDSHSFIQIINGISGETYYISYPLESFSFHRNTLYVKVGNSEFSKNLIHLDIEEDNVKIKGSLHYTGLSEFPKKLFAPGIMGWYSFVPFMECYHGIVSANHFITGKLKINDKETDFSGGKGYIEKDWGTSFPECWIWTQSNSLQKKDASVFVSVAKIPWLGKFFMGFIAFVFLDGRYYMFTSYNRSRLLNLKMEDSVLHMEFSNSKYRMKVEVESRSSGDLIAPKSGSMTRRIKESIDSAIHVKLYDKNNQLIFEDGSGRAGLEIIEGIFDYFK